VLLKNIIDLTETIHILQKKASRLTKKTSVASSIHEKQYKDINACFSLKPEKIKGGPAVIKVVSQTGP